MKTHQVQIPPERAPSDSGHQQRPPGAFRSGAAALHTSPRMVAQRRGILAAFGPTHDPQATQRVGNVIQARKHLQDQDPVNQAGWDALWDEIGTYFDQSAKDWFDAAAKVLPDVPKSTEFGHASKLNDNGEKSKKQKGRGVGSGSIRAEQRFAQLQQEVWEASGIGTNKPKSRAIAQLVPADEPVKPGTS